MGRVEGKVAFVTGAARGQGRSHAIRLAEEGADIIAVDVPGDYDTVGYPMGTEADLADTVKAVEALDRRIVATKADVRDLAALKSAVDDGVAQLGRLDVVCANAGICTVQTWDEVDPAGLAGHAGHQPDRRLEHVRGRGAAPDRPHGGGSIIATSSTAGIKGLPFLAPYVAAKHGVVGISRTMANELAKHRIRVNTVHPTGVDTPMVRRARRPRPIINKEPELGPIFMNTYPVEIVDAARHQQRRALAGLGRVPLRHRPRAHRRRRQHDPLGGSEQMGRVEGKVAFITGAARGQGRSHAIRLAQEGADIIAVDLCEQIDVGAIPDGDAATTWPRRSSRSRRSTAGSSPPQADVRDDAALQAAFDDGSPQLGRLDIVLANAGIAAVRHGRGLPAQAWQDMIDVNLTGVWNTVEAAIPHADRARPGRLDHPHQLDRRR